MALLALPPILLVAGCTSGPAAKPAAPGTVAVGLLVPQTGPNAAIGRQVVQGAQLALEVVNNAFADLPLPLGPGEGLGNGAKLTLAVGDTQSAPERVEEQASALIRDGAVGIVLADDLAVSRAAGRETDFKGVALIDAISTADMFADLNRSGHFRIQPSDRAVVSAALGLLYRERANRQFDRISIASGSATGLAGDQIEQIRGAIRDLGTAAGYAIGDGTIPIGGSGEATAQATGFLVRGDVVFAVVTSAQEATAAAELASRLKGVAPVIMLGPGVGKLDVTKTTYTVHRAASWSAEYGRRNPIARAVGDLYESRFSAKLTDVAAAAFTATLALAVAMDSAPDVSVRSVRSAVQQLSMPATETIMPWDGIRFDGNGNNQLAAVIVEQRTSGGFQVIHPLDLANTSLNWGG